MMLQNYVRLIELPTAHLAFWKDFESAITMKHTTHEEDDRKYAEDATVSELAERS
jgi:hypothetical protein